MPTKSCVINPRVRLTPTSNTPSCMGAPQRDNDVMEKDQTPSFATLLKDSSALPVFCLEKELFEESHTCFWSPLQDDRDQLSCSYQSASLFECSLAESSIAHNDGTCESPVPGNPKGCPATALNTPVMRKMVSVTPPCLEVDVVTEDVWSESMATPTCQRLPSFTGEGWSTETTSTSVQSEVESSSGRARTTLRSKEPLARVLFARDSPNVDSPSPTQPFTPPRDVPSVSSLVLQTHHSTPSCTRHPSTPPHGNLSPVCCSQELFDSPGTLRTTDDSQGEDECEEEDEDGRQSDTGHLVITSDVKLASALDVLFMGSSQLEDTRVGDSAENPTSLVSPPSPSTASLPPLRLPISAEVHATSYIANENKTSFQYPTCSVTIREPLESSSLLQHCDKLACRAIHTPVGSGEKHPVPPSTSGISTHYSEHPCNTMAADKSSLKRFHIAGLRPSVAKKVRTDKEDIIPLAAAVGDQDEFNDRRREHTPAAPCIVDMPSDAPNDNRSSTPVTSRAFSSFKTPSLLVPSAEACSCPAMASRRVLSARRRAGKSFRTPRAAGEVSREEETASIARIMRQFGRTKTGEKDTHPVQQASSSCVSGFSTAGGKRLSVSSAAMQHARQLVDPQDGSVLQHSSSSVSVGFNSASGKSLFVSDTAMEKACNLAASLSHFCPGDQTEAKDDLTSASPPQIACGFQAASGKGFRLSRESMSKAMSLFAELVGAMPTPSALETTRGIAERGLEYSPDETKENQQEKEEEEEEEEKEEEELVPQDIDLDTFATFTQFPVENSRSDGLPSSAVNTAIREEEEEEEKAKESGDAECLCQLQISHLDELSEEMLEYNSKHQEQMQDIASPQEACCNTSAASPSELCGLSDLFECKEDTTLQPTFPPSPDQAYVDHETAAVLDRHTECSEEDQESLGSEIMNKKERRDDGVPAGKAEPPTPFTPDQEGSPGEECLGQSNTGELTEKKEEQKLAAAGLQIASGKTVEISEATLGHVKQLYEKDGGCTGSAPPCSTPVATGERMCSSGLCTAGGREVTISAHSLEHVRRRNTQPSPPPFPGLMTAGGNKVEVSEHALQTVRQSLGGEKMESTHVAFPGLMTASGSMVEVSQQALEAVRLSLREKRQEGNGVSFPALQSTSREPVSSGATETPRPATGGEDEREMSCCSTDQPAPYSGSRSTRSEHRPAIPGTPAVVSIPHIVTPEATLRDRPLNSRRSLQPRTVVASGSALSKHRLKYPRRMTISFTPQEPSPVHSTPHRPLPPVWKGSVQHAVSPPSLPPDVSPPLSPINLTLSQLHTLTDTTLTQGDAPVTAQHGDSGFCSGEKRPGSANSSLQSPPVSCAATSSKLNDSHQEAAGSTKPQIGSLLMCRQSNHSQHLAARQRPLKRTLEQLQTLSVLECVLGVSVSSAPQFIFMGSQFFSSDSVHSGRVCVGDGVMLRLSHEGTAGVHELWRGFRSSPGVDSKLISFQWFSNHYKWLVWKLAALEVCFPEAVGGRWLTPDWLMVQMKYRYDREIDRAERSVLHKICEGDESCSRPMVLCVSHLNSTQGEDRGSVQAPSLELTDGWYSLPVVVDHPLKQLIAHHRITVGCKLLVCGADMVGNSKPCHPLEVAGSKLLKLSANSTRRARWFARMGLIHLTHPPSFLLSSLFPDGGLVPAVKVVVARVYPMLYMEKKEKGNIFRNMKSEQKVALQWEEEKQKAMEVICHRVQQQFESELADEELSVSASTRRRSRRLSSHQLRQLQDGEEIYRALRASPDPDTVQEQLSRTQRALLESYSLSLAAQRQATLQDRITQAMKEEGSKLPVERVVIPLMRVCVVQYGRWRCCKDCILSMWRPAEAIVELLSEGQGVLVSHVAASPNRFRSGRVQLTATKNTSFEILTAEPTLLVNYTPRQCIAISQLRGILDLAHGEFDTVGLVVCITASSRGRPIDQVFLADTSGSVLRINVWDGLKAMEVDKIVIAGAVVAVSNLRLQLNAVHTGMLPTASAGDVTVFQQQPSSSHLVAALHQLRSDLPHDVSQFLRELQNDLLTV